MAIFTLAIYLGACAYLLPIWTVASLLLLAIFLKSLKLVQSLTWPIVLVFAFAYLNMTWQCHSRLTSALPKRLYQEVITVRAELCDLPEPKEHGTEVVVQLSETMGFGHRPRFQGKVKLLWPNAPSLSDNQVWQLQVKLKPFHNCANPGSFDQELYAFRLGLKARGTVNPRFSKLVIHKPSTWSILNLRIKLRDRLQSLLRDCPQGGVVLALIIGSRAGISQSVWQAFLQTGTAHLMAISGLHIGLVAGLIYKVIRLGLRLCPMRYLNQLPLVQILGSVGACLVALIYALLSGFAVSSQRAIIMLAVFTLAKCRRQKIDLLQAWFLAMSVVLILQPLAVLAPSFYLSFVAIACLMLGMQYRLQAKGIIWQYFRAQWVIGIGMAPLGMYLFGKLSLLGLVANTLAIPWVSLVTVPLALMGAALSYLQQDIARISLIAAAKSIVGLNLVLNYLLQHGQGLCLEKSLSFSLMLIASLGAMVLLIPGPKMNRMVAIIGCLPIIMPKPNAVKEGQALITVLDVGQGLSTIIKTRNHLVVYDTGLKLGSSDSTEQVIWPYLLSKGQTRVHTLIVSHGDSDHAGGAQSLYQRQVSMQVLASEPERLKMPSKLCERGQKFNLDGVGFELLGPNLSQNFNRNNKSCVLMVQAGKERFLLTGDIEAKAEAELLKTYANRLKAEVLLIPHHGSKTSSSPDFVAAVHPHLAIVPAGFLNPWSFPHQGVLDTYAELGIKVLNTAQTGAIEFVLGSGKALQPELYRRQAHEFWLSRHLKD